MVPILAGVMGPTASGKTELAERLAERLDALLVNADAFQIYRGMDIGTAKPSDKGKYSLLDIRDPNQTFGVGEWVQLAQEILQGAWAAGKSVVVVGGTGLNFRALFESYSGMMTAPDPQLREKLNARLEQEGLALLVEELKSRDTEAYGKVDLSNPVRVIRAIERSCENSNQLEFKLPPFRKAKFGLNVPTDQINDRIEIRANVMVQNGWAHEIERLLEEGFRVSDPGFRAIGYRVMAEVVSGEKSLNEAIAETVFETRRYAKRQRTWLRSEPNLIELAAGTGEDTFQRALDFLALD